MIYEVRAKKEKEKSNWKWKNVLTKYRKNRYEYKNENSIISKANTISIRWEISTNSNGSIQTFALYFFFPFLIVICYHFSIRWKCLLYVCASIFLEMHRIEIIALSNVYYIYILYVCCMATWCILLKHLVSTCTQWLYTDRHRLQYRHTMIVWW